MSPELTNFLFEAANFLVLAAALGWVLFKPVRRALEAEEARRAETETEAEDKRRQAEQLLQQAQDARDALAEELEKTRADMLSEAREAAATIQRQAREQQQREQRTLAHKLEGVRHAQAQALADTLGRIAAESLVQLMQTMPGPDLDEALVAAACRELETLPEAGRTAATIESARPLSEASRARLQAILGALEDVRLVPELGAGVRVTGRTGQVDCSARNLARALATSVVDAATAEADLSAGSQAAPASDAQGRTASPGPSGSEAPVSGDGAGR